MIDTDKVLNDWLEFCEMPTLKIDEMTFFPEFILPHAKQDIFNVLAQTYQNIKNDASMELQIDSIAVNVGRLSKFTALVHAPYKTFLQKMLSYEELSSDEKQNSVADLLKDRSKFLEIDEGLTKHLLEGLLQFCRVTGYDQERMIRNNSIYLAPIIKT